MSQTGFAGWRLTISDLDRARARPTAAAPAALKPATPARSATPAPAKAKAAKQKPPKSPAQVARAAANLERDR